MLKFGAFYFKWQQQTLHRPNRQFIIIQQLDHPKAKLEIEIIGRQEALKVKELEWWVEWAVKRAWSRETPEHWKLQKTNQEIHQLDSLIQDEIDLAKLVSTQSIKRPLSAFEQQQNWQEIESFEQLFEYSWPSCLKQLYTYNGIEGGWGPDSGFFPLFPTTAHQHSWKDTRKYFQTEHPASNLWRYYPSLVPFLHWGTSVYSLIDLNTAKGTVYSFDPNLKQSYDNWESCLWVHQDSLYNWIKFWLDSKDYGVQLWRQMYQIKKIL